MPSVIDLAGRVLREEPTPAAFAGDRPRAKTHTIFRAVFRELANPRAGTASTKKRDEVSGGGKKPWRQKGTGRARHGSIREPQWRHGGVVFGPQPRSYVTSLNKKERRAALVAALADRFAGGGVAVLETDGFALSKTRELASLLFGSPKGAKSGPRTLVVYGPSEEAQLGERLGRLGRNLQRVRVTATGTLDVKDVLAYERLVLTANAYAALASTAGGIE